MAKVCSYHRIPLEGRLTAWAAWWTIFIWPLWSCTFRKRRLRNRSTAQLNSLESSKNQSEVWQALPTRQAPPASQRASNTVPILQKRKVRLKEVTETAE